MQAEYFALEGVSELVQTLDRVRDGFRPELVIEGVVLTMYDERTNLAQQVTENLREFFGDKLLKTNIPRNIRLAEAPVTASRYSSTSHALGVQKATWSWRARFCCAIRLKVRESWRVKPMRNGPRMERKFASGPTPDPLFLLVCVCRTPVLHPQLSLDGMDEFRENLML